MCCRYSVFVDYRIVKKIFNADYPQELIVETYNAAPSDNLPAILNISPNQIELLRWGLIPFWAKDSKIGFKTANARAETIDQKPSFREAFKRKRCLVIANAYYEWKKNKKNKTPFKVSLEGYRPFAFAGLWDEWKDENNKLIKTFAIITTSAQGVMRDLHERVPVILDPEHYKIWLSESNNTKELKSLLVPFESFDFNIEEISERVNSTKNNDASLLKPI